MENIDIKQDRCEKNRSSKNIISIYFNDSELEIRKNLDLEAREYGFKTISDYVKNLLFSRKSILEDKQNLLNKEIELKKLKQEMK